MHFIYFILVNLSLISTLVDSLQEISTNLLCAEYVCLIHKSRNILSNGKCKNIRIKT